MEKTSEERMLATLAPAWRAVAARWTIPGYDREDVELVAEEAALEWIRRTGGLDGGGIAAYRCGRYVNRALSVVCGKADRAHREVPSGLAIDSGDGAYPSDHLLEAALSQIDLTVVQRSLCEMVSQGYDVEFAAAVVGVGKTLAFREMNAIRSKVATLLSDGGDD